MKRLLVSSALLFVFIAASAQYYDATPKRVLRYSEQDSAGTLTGYTEYVNKDISEKDGVTTVNQDNISYVIKNGNEKKYNALSTTLVINADNATQNMNLSRKSGIIKMKMSGSFCVLPNRIDENTVLPPYTIKAAVRLLIFSEDGYMHFMNRKVLGRETITVPAGTFDCWKISEDKVMTMDPADITVLGRTGQVENDEKKAPKDEGKRTIWVSKNVGIVQIVEYKTSGAVDSTDQLISIK